MFLQSLSHIIGIFQLISTAKPQSFPLSPEFMSISRQSLPLSSGKRNIKILLKNIYSYQSFEFTRDFFGKAIFGVPRQTPKLIINSQTRGTARISYKKIPTSHEKHPFYKASICFPPQAKESIYSFPKYKIILQRY